MDSEYYPQPNEAPLAKFKRSRNLHKSLNINRNYTQGVKSFQTMLG